MRCTTMPLADRRSAIRALLSVSMLGAAFAVPACSSSENDAHGEFADDAAVVGDASDATTPDDATDATSENDAGDVDLDAGAPLTVTCAQQPCVRELTGMVRAGGTFCALLDGGKVVCWGRNYSYFLGRGADAGTDSSGVPQEVLGIENAIGVEQSCAILQGGAVKCWGPGNFLQPNPTYQYSEPVTLPIPPVRSLSIGYGINGCATFQTGEISCWGFVAPPNVDAGGTIYDSNGGLEPFHAPDGFDVVQVKLGFVSLVRNAKGDVLSWGDRGSLGRISSLPVDPDPLPITVKDVTAMDVAANAACVVAHGKAYCWGSTTDYGSTLYPPLHPLPELVPLPKPARAVSVGSVLGASVHPFACAITVDHELYCWGENAVGQVGNGTAGSTVYFPEKVDLPGRVVSVSALTGNACALLESGQVYCWGVNTSGELGRGNRGNAQATPGAVIFP